MERAVTMNISGSLLPKDFVQFGIASAEDLRSEAEREVRELQTTETAAVEIGMASKESVAEEAPPGSLDDMTRGHILEVLHHTKGILGIGRYSLYRMAKRLNIDLDRWNTEPRSGRRKRVSAPASANSVPVSLAAFDQLDDIVYTRDFAGLTTSINAAGERFFGIPREQIVGRSFHSLVDPAMEDSLKTTNDKLLAEGHDRSEVIVRDRDGRARVLEFNVALFRDASGQPAGARGIMRDVSEAKELESRLRSQAQLLEEANEKLKDLNRIKADFTAMLVALQLLQEILPSEANEDLHKVIAGGLASGRSMVQIVEDMLELFKFDSTEVPLASDRVPVGELIEDPFNEALVQAQLKGIDLTQEIETGLPDVLVDRVKICRTIC
ncbi:MAG: PAS domain S-box protein [Acidobacteria bacterium]|nr:PAS domain S-box protein [Acidobacteriota bacterium]MCI0718795.1 PAS domain S-box protein [Acidobacteriota bacterium]